MREETKELVVLTADRQQKEAVGTLLRERHHSIGIEEVSFDIFDHPNRDPGCYRECQDFLRGFVETHDRALVVFDLHGSGADGLPTDVELEVQERLVRAGWEDEMARCVVISPELEIWVFSDSPEVEKAVGWPTEEHPTDMRSWLEDQGLWASDAPKPRDPKEALSFVLQRTRRPRSSALFAKLARNVGLSRCVDESFDRFRGALTDWFS